MDARTFGAAPREQPRMLPPKDMPNVVMDLSYALDHKPDEVVEPVPSR